MKQLALVGLVLAACAAPPPPRAAAPLRRLGDAMAETGVRFQRIGRAAHAGRWELASYDLDELAEIFREDLAANPWESNPKLPPLAQSFQAKDLAAVKVALGARDPAAFDRAIEQAAHSCNTCHEAAKKAYIEISPEPGAESPKIAP
jgi:hypothetical protein